MIVKTVNNFSNEIDKFDYAHIINSVAAPVNCSPLDDLCYRHADIAVATATTGVISVHQDS